MMLEAKNNATILIIEFVFIAFLFSTFLAEQSLYLKIEKKWNKYYIFQLKNVTILDKMYKFKFDTNFKICFLILIIPKNIASMLHNFCFRKVSFFLNCVIAMNM